MIVTKRTRDVFASTLLFGSLAVGSASAQDAGQPSAEPTLSPTRVFAEKTGEALYNNVCQACHMSGGKGATGAGFYPALASNPKLEAAGYPLTVVLHGLKGMPPVGKMMNDEQVAEVVNYVRTHFGNAYQDKVTPQEVAGAR
jgi:mono/diheme cytochrome c family protein